MMQRENKESHKELLDAAKAAIEALFDDLEAPAEQIIASLNELRDDIVSRIEVEERISGLKKPGVNAPNKVGRS